MSSNDKVKNGKCKVRSAREVTKLENQTKSDTHTKTRGVIVYTNRIKNNDITKYNRKCQIKGIPA